MYWISQKTTMDNDPKKGKEVNLRTTTRHAIKTTQLYPNNENGYAVVLIYPEIPNLCRWRESAKCGEKKGREDLSDL